MAVSLHASPSGARPFRIEFPLADGSQNVVDHNPQDAALEKETQEAFQNLKVLVKP
jgi:hypothetical protein